MQTTTTWQVLPETFGIFSDADINWIAASGLQIKVEAPKRMSINDSGWCDASTGHEILTSNHKIYVITETPEQETWVKLYWEDRAFVFETTQYEAINIVNSLIKG